MRVRVKVRVSNPTLNRKVNARVRVRVRVRDRVRCSALDLSTEERGALRAGGSTAWLGVGFG